MFKLIKMAPPSLLSHSISLPSLLIHLSPSLTPWLLLPSATKQPGRLHHRDSPGLKTGADKGPPKWQASSSMQSYDNMLPANWGTHMCSWAAKLLFFCRRQPELIPANRKLRRIFLTQSNQTLDFTNTVLRRTLKSIWTTVHYGCWQIFRRTNVSASLFIILL